MEQDKLSQEQLAQLLLDRALGRPDLAATSGAADEVIPMGRSYHYLKKMDPIETHNRRPIVTETPSLSTTDKKTRLFARPGPEPSGPLVSPIAKKAMSILQQAHPDALRRAESIHFESRPEGEFGELRGGPKTARLLVDPHQATDNAPNLLSGVVAALRHELAHAMRYPDNYEDQPMTTSKKGQQVYGRRDLPISGKPRDAQDIDLASIILSRVGKK